jgi:hypothetical protein
MEDNGKTKLKLNVSLLPDFHTITKVGDVLHAKRAYFLSFLIGQLSTTTFPDRFFSDNRKRIKLSDKIVLESPFNYKYRGKKEGKIVLVPEKKKTNIIDIRDYLLPDVSGLISENLVDGSADEGFFKYCESLVKNRYLQLEMTIGRNVTPKHSRSLIRKLNQHIDFLSFDRVQFDLDTKYVQREKDTIPLRDRIYG